MMNIRGQGNYRTSKRLKHKQALPDIEALYRIGCLRGTTGAARIIAPIHDEGSDAICNLLRSELSDDELASIKTFTVDHATEKLDNALRELCPQFECLIQDSKHLEIRYRSAFWGKHSPGGKLLSLILSKFNRYSEMNGATSQYYRAGNNPRQSPTERNCLAMIIDGRMPIANAMSYVESIDFNLPFINRLSFIKAIAALVALYPEEVKRPVAPGPLKIRSVLYNACLMDSLEYKLNHTRLLHLTTDPLRNFIASGSTSVEALHSELKNHWFPNWPKYYQSTVLLKTAIFRFAKLYSHNKMMLSTTNRAYRQQIVMKWSAAAETAWDEHAWAMHCSSPLRLPLMKLKKMHKSANRAHEATQVAKDPVNVVITRRGQRQNIKVVRAMRRQKLTPFNIPRRSAVVRSTAVCRATKNVTK